MLPRHDHTLLCLVPGTRQSSKCDGIGLAQRLRADSRSANVPIILMTASGASDLPALSLEDGTTEFLRKPFRPQELLDRLRCHWSPDDFPSIPTTCDGVAPPLPPGGSRFA